MFFEDRSEPGHKFTAWKTFNDTNQQLNHSQKSGDSLCNEGKNAITIDQLTNVFMWTLPWSAHKSSQVDHKHSQGQGLLLGAGWRLSVAFRLAGHPYTVVQGQENTTVTEKSSKDR